MRARPVFSADSIGKSFGERTVLTSASLWAHAGAVSVLLGRNGCGKSTLLRIACGLLRADHGVVRFRDRAYLRPRHAQLARLGLFFLPDRDLLSPQRTLRSHFDAARWYRGGASVDYAVDRMNVRHFLDQHVSQLSSGETRRAEIAIALSRQPICLIADEPFSGISPRDAEGIGDAIVEIARSGCAVVVTGHEVPQLMQVADDITWMVSGGTIGIGDRLDARIHAQFQRDYLNVII